MKVRWLQLALAAWIAMALAGGAVAQSDYPNRAVKIVVGYVPGGGPDIAARTLAQKLTEILGQPFVVENRPGAGATTATAFVAKAPADGYTLLLGETGQLMIAPYIYKRLAYNTEKDFTPISMFLSGPLILVANPKFPAKTVAELIREVKAQPGKFDAGSSGIGSLHHIAMEAFKSDAGLDVGHIPYKGSGQSLSAILSGDVPLLVTSLTAAAPQIAAGKLNLLAVTSGTRVPYLPDVPSLGEFAKDYDFSSESGLLGPAGLPAEVLARLSRAVKQAVESPEMAEAFRKSNTLIRYTTPEEYAENIRRNLRKYERAIRSARIPQLD